MAKFKAIRPGKDKKAPPAQGALPCVVLILLGVALLSLLLYFALRSSD
jgi:hypothetical protein